MGIFEAIKKGFAETSKLMNIVLVFFIFNVTIGLISLPLTDPARVGNPGIVAISIISSIIFFLIFIFLQGGALGMIKDHIKTANSSMGQFIVYGKQYYLRILGLLLMYILIAIGIVLLLGLISAGVLLLGDTTITRGIVAFIVTVATVSLVTLLVYPVYAIVADDISAFEALKKGVCAAKANFVKTLGLFIVLLLVSLVISLVVGFIVGLITVPMGTVMGQVVIAIINAGVQSYIPIVMMIAFMGLYMSLPSCEAPESASDEASEGSSEGGDQGGE